MDLRDYVRLLRRNWFILVIGALIGLLAGLLYSGSQDPRFQSTAAVVVSTGQSSDTSDLNAGNTFAQQAVKTYATIATSPLVLDPVIDQLQLDTTPAGLAASVSTSVPLDTSVLQITVQDASAGRAAAIANAISTALREAVTGLSPSTAATADVSVTLIQPAVVSGSPVSPKVPIDAALGLIAGLVLALGAVALREALGTRVRDEQDVQGLTERPVIGRILYDRRLREKPLLFRTDPSGTAAEAFRALRTSLHFIDFEGERQRYVITSAVDGEGKSVCAANLAAAIGQAGQRVVVVDADLRRPQLGAYFELDDSIGLSDVLVGDVELHDALQEVPDAGLFVLPAGRLPPNPTELLQSKAMIRLLDELGERFQAVILDGPPLLPVSDSAILAKRTDGALLVASVAKVKRPQLRGALKELQGVTASVLGVVLTMVPASGASAYGYAARDVRRSRHIRNSGPAETAS